MKKILTVFLLLALSLPSFANIFEGKISEQGKNNLSRIIDKSTGEGISGAQITLPKERYSTKTDKEGYFELDTSIDHNKRSLFWEQRTQGKMKTINSMF
jgi:hypothetical protein